MTTLPINNEQVWELPPRAQGTIHIRIDRNALIAIIFSMLLHVLLLWQAAPKLFEMGAPDKPQQPLQITLGPPQKKEVAPKEANFPSPPDQPQKVKPQKSLKPSRPTPIESAKLPKPPSAPSNFTLPKSIEKPQPIDPAASMQPLPDEDMQTFIRRQKTAKLAAQGYSKQDIEESMENMQSAGEKRDEKIKDNLNLNGTNGLFEIRALGQHAAQFSFKGWKNNINNARLEIIDVTAPDGMDIRRAVVKKMIEIIRREYSGDFNFDSQRLGRVIKLSARQEDNEALEEFMMREFFGNGSRYRQ